MIRHLIVFNIREEITHENCLEIIEIGKDRLSKIPGVINISFGIAVKETAKYKYSLAIDFADEGVIESYKLHPIHVEYADTYFRPMAIDRITTDYVVLF